MERIFSKNTVRVAAEKIRMGEKPKYSVSEKLSREDIERAWRTAYVHSMKQHDTTIILQDALRNTVRALRFLDDYANLLQEYISPDDYNAAMEHFDEIAEAHRRVPRDLPNEQIAREAKAILEITGEELSSDELADILNLKTLSVEKALSEYSIVKELKSLHLSVTS